MRKLLLILISWICMCSLHSQSYNIDSLRNLLSKSKTDTHAIRMMNDLALSYVYFHPDSSYYFGRQAYLLAGQLGDTLAEANGLTYMSVGLRQMGNYPLALDYALKSLKISEQMNYQNHMLAELTEIASIYYFQQDGKNCIVYALRAMDFAKGSTNVQVLEEIYEKAAEGYELMKMYDSCIFYTQKCYTLAIKTNDEREIEFCNENLADYYFKTNKYEEAFVDYKLALPYFISQHVDEGTTEAALFLAQIFERKNKPDSAQWYADLSLRVAQSSKLTSRQSETIDFLTAFYKRRQQSDSALKYLELSVALKDSLFNKEKVQDMQNLTFDENNRQQEIAEEKKKEHEASIRNLQLIAIAIFIPVFFLIVLFLAKIRVKPRVVEFLAIIDLLLFFEFITDLIYPYITSWTNDQPIGEMLILVLIAAALEPLNFGLENWVKKHLVERPVPANSIIAAN
jgi:hypothetical protein